MCLLALYVFGEMAESSSHFLIVVVFWSFGLSCLYILEIKPLLIASFADIFSHSTDYLFILFLVSFAVQKLVSLIWSRLLIFVFISVAWGDWPKKTTVRSMSENALPVFSCRSFTGSCFIFKSLSHFIYSEFISEYGLRVCAVTIDLRAAVQPSRHHLLRRLFPLSTLASFIWTNGAQACASAPGLRSVSVPMSRPFDYCCLVLLSGVRGAYAFSFVHFLQRCFGAFGSFMVPCKF